MVAKTARGLVIAGVAVAVAAFAVAFGSRPGAAVSQPGAGAQAPGVKPQITVFKTPTCGCCSKWVEHLKDHGFDVVTQDMDDVTPVRVAKGVPAALTSCHTATVDDYVIEGHVPADLIHRLLKERPRVVGLAVPGMPAGAPGMEGPRQDPYRILTFDRAGQTTVFASR